MDRAADVSRLLRSAVKPGKAGDLARFFKTGRGEYADGDKFIGVMVPEQRWIARKFIHLPLPEIKKLLTSSIHEERLTALFILIYQFAKSDQKHQELIYRFYLRHLRHINNWDLVDSSAPYLLGPFLYAGNQKILTDLAGSQNMWERRVAVLATFFGIKNQDYVAALLIAAILINDPEDLIHKAVGWMLREIGKRDQALEEKFLQKHYRSMPRTMLRYAIEKFPEQLRQRYLRGVV